MKSLLVLTLVAVASAELSAWERIHGTNPSTRITGGEEAKPHSVGFIAGLFIYTADSGHFCGGSLISKDYVVTAAHCCELSKNITVVLGAHNITNANETTQQRTTASNILIHPKWDSATLKNDICIITLLKSATLNAAVYTITLPNKSQICVSFAGRYGTASGWGITSDGSETISPVLNIVGMKILDNLTCRIQLGLVGLYIRYTHICTSGAKGKSTCSGDSGGPLVVSNDSGEEILVGATSFGSSEGCEVGRPAVYTCITEYLDWISSNTDIIIPF